MNMIYAYLRVSGKKQIGGSGYARQLDTIKKYCAEHQLKIAKVYKEQVSGTKGEADRKQFTAMIAEIMRDGVNTVIVESLDRLAREYVVQEQLLVYLISKGIRLINASTEENITEAIESNPIRKAMVQIQGIFAELDKSLLVEKLRKGRERKRKEEGWREGPQPYGSKPGEKEVLKRIRYARRLNRGQYRRRSYQSIADELNKDGIKTRQGKRWDAALVYNVLRKK